MPKDYDEHEYFLHYSKHTYYVVLAWKQIQDIIIHNNLISEEEFNKINELIVWHDNSKITKEEWIPYARRFNGGDIEDKDKVKIEFKKAVKLHKDSNLHHFETLKNYVGPYWRCYIVEMICDYIAMGWEFGTYIFEYYEATKEQIDLPPLYKKYLEDILNLLRSLGEVEEPLTLKRMSHLYFS